MLYYLLVFDSLIYTFGAEVGKRMQKRYWENEYRDILICVDRYKNRIPKGHLVHPSLGRAVQFYGVIQLLRIVESLLDELRFPETFSCLRKFQPLMEEPLQPAAVTPDKGLSATFRLRILFRQNSTWQGTVQWLEGKRDTSFRSTLELLFLLDNALCPDDGGKHSDEN